MPDGATPTTHPSVTPTEIIHVDDRTVACDGGDGPLGPSEGFPADRGEEVVCPYCSRLYVLNPGAGHAADIDTRDGAPIRRARKPAPPGPDRRIGLHLPRLPRSAADDAAGRHAGERRVRLHQHAGQAAEGSCRHAYRGDLRRRPADLPQPALRRLQGQPPAAAGGTDPAIRPRAGSDRGVRRPGDRAGRLGGRRPDRRLRAGSRADAAAR